MRDILFRSLSLKQRQHEKLRYQKQKQLKKFGSNPNVQFSFFYEPNVQIDSLNFFKTKKIPFTVTRERQKITGGIREIILIARMYG